MDGVDAVMMKNDANENRKRGFHPGSLSCSSLEEWEPEWGGFGWGELECNPLGRFCDFAGDAVDEVCGALDGEVLWVACIENQDFDRASEIVLEASGGIAGLLVIAGKDDEGWLVDGWEATADFTG